MQRMFPVPEFDIVSVTSNTSLSRLQKTQLSTIKMDGQMQTFRTHVGDLGCEWLQIVVDFSVV